MNRIARLTQTAVVLLVSPLEEDPIHHGQDFDGFDWTVREVSTCREAMVVMREDPPEVVICERDFSDGNWKDILETSKLLEHPPALIVTSRLADELLWADVLNLGGYDVLAKPLDKETLLWAIDSARLHWTRQNEQPKRLPATVPDHPVIQTWNSVTDVQRIACERKAKNMFENFEDLDAQIKRVQGSSSGKWSHILQIAGVLSGVLLVTFLLFWGLHIGIIFSE